MKSKLIGKLNNRLGITELFFAENSIGWVQRIENGSYKAHSYMSGKIYHGQKIKDVCLQIEKELDRK